MPVGSRRYYNYSLGLVMAAITNEQIHQAADALDADGVRPTLAAVRKRLGGGSFTTISAAMADWRAGRERHAALAPAPDDLLDRAAALAAEIWAAANTTADARLAGLREELAVEREALHIRAAEAAGLADQLATDLDAQTAARQAADTLVDQLRSALAVAEQAEAVARARADALTEAFDKERQALREELHRTQTAADNARTERDQARAAFTHAANAKR